MRTVLAALALAATVVLAGCGGGKSEPKRLASCLEKAGATIGHSGLSTLPPDVQSEIDTRFPSTSDLAFKASFATVGATFLVAPSARIAEAAGEALRSMASSLDVPYGDALEQRGKVLVIWEDTPSSHHYEASVVAKCLK